MVMLHKLDTPRGLEVAGTPFPKFHRNRRNPPTAAIASCSLCWRTLVRGDFPNLNVLRDRLQLLQNIEQSRNLKIGKRVEMLGQLLALEGKRVAILTAESASK